MIKTCSEIVINSETSKAFNAIVDVSLWPEMFQPCQEVILNSTSNSEQIMTVKAKSIFKVHSWRSKRLINYSNYVIDFKQLETVYPIVNMLGSWEFKVEGNVTRVKLMHCFSVSVKNKILEKIIEILIKKIYVDRNSQRELRGLKKYCEGK
ncbi:hypothetical protein [Streptococcus gordonii]|jgi:hypothetical protein|uniref:hypothetical protein n=1 Tax=Streptococcus gordonii TaxID=1302 RepID=UPI000778F735|nr:hypothetical protein [Streptococcus gordonii]VTT23656.1 Uncharacterised protein [Streptococcus gordonii]